LKRILSGVQPSGKLHIGNYFGAIKQHIALQDAGECFYFIASYHALNSLKDSESKDGTRPAKDILAASVQDVALDYLALGLDPARTAFYRQSDVPEVTELAWMLATVTGMGLLERAHSYKDKVARGQTASVGLFTYPILMAADILIVRSTVVPVGKDQVQHLEMTRDMATYFNQAYGEVFPLPSELMGETPVVPGTDGQKMSKSYGNTIDIFAEGKALQTQVMSVVTDSTPLDEPKNPETCNVVALYKLFADGNELQRMHDLYKNPTLDAESRKGRSFGYGDAKKLLFTKIDSYFAEARARRKVLIEQPERVDAALKAGAAKARAEALKTMALVRQGVGISAAPH
jgi:tryptophanyl-tRNA synthetase